MGTPACFASRLLAGCLLVLGCLAWAAAARAENEEPVRVEAAGAEQIETEPGEVVTVLFRVTNTLSEPRTFDPSLSLPEGWQRVLAQGTFTLEPEASDLRLISFQIPTDPPPGLYEVRYAARDTRNPISFDEGTVTVRIAPTHGLELQLEAAPRLVLSGDPFTVQVRLINKGNTESWVAFMARDNAGFSVSPGSARVHLAPHASERVAVVVEPEDNVERALRHVLRIEVHDEDLPDSKAHLGVVSDVIPNGGRARSSRRVWPAELAVRGLGGGEGAGYQVDFTGSGALLGGTVDAAFTVPDQRRTSLYRDWSQYSLRYASEALDLYAGDQVYSLSPLTEVGQYGFGAGGSGQAGPVTVGGFYNRQRHTFLQEEHAGGFVAYQANEETRLSAQVLNRRGFRDGNLASVRAVLTDGTSARLDSECGLGVRTDLESRVANACSFRLNVDWPWLSYAGTILRSGSAYPGRTYGIGALAGSAVVRPWSWFQVEGAAQDQHRTFETGAERNTRLYRVGAGFTARPFGQAAHLFAYYQGRLFDLLPDAFVWDRRETSYRVQAGVAARRVSVRGSVELGEVRNDQLGYEGPFQRYQASARWSLHAAGSLNATIEHFRGRTVYRSTDRSQWRVGVGTSLALTPRMSMSLSVMGYFDPDSEGKVFASAQTRLQHTFSTGHRMEIEGRQFASGETLDRGTGEYRVTYAVPFGIPLGPDKLHDPISGRVYDAETGAGFEGVFMTLDGRTVITDANGVFRLSRPISGSAYLHLDRISAGLALVPMIDLPMEIRSDGERRREINIPMQRGARLVGELRLPGNEQESAGREILDAVVELRAGDRRLRALADREGAFQFSEVPPGPWTLRVLHARLPDHHRVEQDAYSILLTPGGEERVQINVVPVQRQIRMIESGTVLSGRPEVPAGRPPQR